MKKNELSVLQVLSRRGLWGITVVAVILIIGFVCVLMNISLERLTQWQFKVKREQYCTKYEMFVDKQNYLHTLNDGSYFWTCNF